LRRMVKKKICFDGTEEPLETDLSHENPRSRLGGSKEHTTDLEDGRDSSSIRADASLLKARVDRSFASLRNRTRLYRWLSTKSVRDWRKATQETIASAGLSALVKKERFKCTTTWQPRK
jgi:hypothetical protein